MSPEETYNQIAEQTQGVTKGKMFGALCLKTPNGKAACLFKNDMMAFKLQGTMADEANSLDGTQTFEPAPGKFLNGWVQVPFEYANRWVEFTNASVNFVKAL